MSQDTVLRIRGLYEDWIKDESTHLDYSDFFAKLLEYTTDVEKDICGKCIPCRDGIPIIEELIQRFEDGTATKNDLIKIEEYVENLRSSKCSVGDQYGKVMEVVMRNNFNDFYKKVR